MRGDRGSARSIPASGRPPYQGEKFVGAVRLFQQRHGTGGQRPAPARRIGPGGGDDDREPVAAAAQLFEHFKAAHPGHVEVEYQAIAVTGRSDGVEEAAAGCEISCFEAFAFDEKA